ncbi:hypothetical protein B9Z51_08600 [Limnohabitans sp. T6-5]|uniref:hypothetical protein n=1 Tax=Limnohabitans sp. T6-5 TaxID=1100724 RepID=UPI000D3C9A5B|nr:hypothetical protein [Limnohabitans sp. T6-5]PUE08983.1 hypothetical protein B9Z51_08600 [Limnohabitans sp. T6-5]
MLIKSKFDGYTRDGVRVLHFGGGGSSPPPDYTPMAEATREATAAGERLGQQQIDESRRQYDRTMELSAPILDAQKKTMDLAYQQGKTNFDNFQNEGRPLQQQMRDIAMGNINPDVQRQMDKAATENVADVSAQLDNQRQQTNRNMMRMGINPGSGKFAALSGEMDTNSATAKASAANVGRTNALDKVYARSGDVLNTYSGMASQAPAFYSAGTNAGNSAVGNSNAIGSTLTSGMASGAGTMMQGRQQAIQGLGGILNSQTSMYNANTAADGQATGALIGGGAMIAVAI